MQHCPKCNSNSGVIDSRVLSSGNIRRRRKCVACGARWNTVEILLARATQMDNAEAALQHLQKMLAMVAPATSAL